jgi:hypothetical protein
MQTIVIVGMLFYSLSYLTTAILFRHYVSKETDRSRGFDISDRRFQVNAINVAVALIVMAITYFFYIS